VNGVQRVDGKILLTRALGDPTIPCLSHEPEIRSFDLSDEFFDETKYLILACDGVWDFMTYVLC
jgi:serine/threonine protein phosphatase PrpC